MPKEIVEFSCRLTKDDDQKAVVQIAEDVDGLIKAVRNTKPNVFTEAVLYGLRVYAQGTARKAAKKASKTPTTADLLSALRDAVTAIGLTVTTANVVAVNRTSAEVQAFRRLSPDEQRELLQLLAERRKAAETSDDANAEPDEPNNA